MRVSFVGRKVFGGKRICLLRMFFSGGKLSLGLVPYMFQRVIDHDGWIVTVLGVRVHWKRDYASSVLFKKYKKA